MPRKIVLCLAAAVALAGCKRESADPATAPSAQAPADSAPSAPVSSHAFSPELTTGDFAELVKTLASDAFEGRGPGTPGEEKTVTYIRDQMQRIGLQPGNGDSWFQDVPMVETTADPATAPSLRSGAQSRPLTFGTDIVVGTRTGQAEVKLDNSELVFVGYGVDAPEQQWNDYAGQDWKGKTVVMFVNDPGFHSNDAKLFDGKRMTYYGRWTYKYEEGARQGALGVLVVHETAPASYGWDTVASSNTNTMFDVVRDNPRAAHPTLEGWVQRDLAARLFTQAGLDFDTLKKQAQTRAFKPVELKGQRLSASYTVKSDVITSHNVVARLEGSTHPDETLIYSAHWDHIGVGKPDARGDTIFNGALDNASGTAALLELARGFAKGPKPERSVVFLAVTAEEKGLLGSEFYASKPLYPLATTVAVINMDGMNPFVPSRDFGIYGTAKLELLDQLKTVAGQWKLRYTPDPKPEAGYFFRSDHFSFAKRGVPALSYAAGQDWEVGGVAAGKAASDDYTAKRYHQQGDEWKPDWTFAGAARDLGILYALGQQLADARTWPNWSSDSEFRATRDTSADARK